MMLKVFAEERLIGEVQLVGYLLNALLGRFQHGFRFQNHQAVNPLARRLSTHLFHHGGKMLRGKEHLVSIIRHAPLLFIVFGNIPYEAFKQIFLAAFRSTLLSGMPLIDVVYLVEQSQQQSLRNLLAVRVVFQLHLAPQERVIFLERLQLVGGDIDARPLLYHEKHGKQLLHGRYHQIHEISGHRYKAAGEIIGTFALLHDLLGQDDTKHSLFHFIFLQVDVHLTPAFPADSKAGGVQARRIWRKRNIPYIIKNSEIIADKVNHGQMLYSGDINVAYLFCIHCSCALPANIGLFTELLI